MKPLTTLLVVGLTALAQQPALDFKELAEDTKLTSASGATFTVAKGWHVARTDGLIVIQEPQRELAAAFAEVTAPNVEDAIAQGWSRWKPDFARVVRQTAKPPATAGWDEIAQIAYQTAADERRIVTGIARRKGTTYYVTLIDGARRGRRAARGAAQYCDRRLRSCGTDGGKPRRPKGAPARRRARREIRSPSQRKRASNPACRAWRSLSFRTEESSSRKAWASASWERTRRSHPRRSS